MDTIQNRMEGTRVFRACKMITTAPRKAKEFAHPQVLHVMHGAVSQPVQVRSRTHRPDNTESPDLAESNQIRQTACECLRFGAIHSFFGLRTNKRGPPRATKLEAAHKAIMCITRRPLFLVSSHHHIIFSASGARNSTHKGSHVAVEESQPELQQHNHARHMLAYPR